MSLNKVMLIGNVGKDPEVRYLEGNGQAAPGRKVANFTLATSERYKDRSGEVRENTEWHNIVVWGQPADVVERFVKKGTQLYIEGRITTRSWTDQSGAKRYTTEIRADSLQLLGRREQEGGYAPAQAQQGYQQAPTYQAQPTYQQAPGYQQPQQSYQQPAYQPQPAAPAAPIADDPNDDLPF